MTIASIASLARQRSARAADGAEADTRVVPVAPPDHGAPDPVGQATRLADAVPVDVIVLYTTVIGVLAGVLKEAGANSYLPLRWTIYIGCIVAICILVPVTYTLGPPADAGNQDAPKLHLSPSVTAPPPGQTPPQEARRLPVAETAIAALSFAFWGLVVPGSPLYVMLDPPTLPVTVTTLSAVGVFLLTSLAPPLLRRTANTRRTTAAPVPEVVAPAAP